MTARPPALQSFRSFVRVGVHAPKHMTPGKTHEERTASDRREACIHAVTLAKVEQSVRRVRLIRLKPQKLTKDENPLNVRDGDDR